MSRSFLEALGEAVIARLSALESLGELSDEESQQALAQGRAITRARKQMVDSYLHLDSSQIEAVWDIATPPLNHRTGRPDRLVSRAQITGVIPGHPTKLSHLVHRAFHQRLMPGWIAWWLRDRFDQTWPVPCERALRPD
jgi:hypothetical protein